MSALEIIANAQSGKINPDPIAQRPPVTQGTTKSEQIVECLLNGYGVGMLTLRDISNDLDMQKVYPGVKHLVIDGGHRVRALVAFYQGKFPVDTVEGRKIFLELDVNLHDYQIPYMSVECNSIEATMMFRNINTVTPVNFIEMVMSNEISEVCKEVRSRTKFYKEYGNRPSTLFEVTKDNHGKDYALHWDTAPNHRRKWDEYVFIAMIKALGGGNVDAGQREIEELAENGFITKTALSVVDKFLSDAVTFKFNRGKKFNTDVFAAFQLVWFGLYGKNKVFKISDSELFQQKFMLAYTKLTGISDSSLNKTVIEYKGETHLIKEFVRKNIKNFSNSAVQQECFNLFLQYMPSNEKQFGIIFRDENRTANLSMKEEQLIKQNYICPIDRLPLKLEDGEWAHNTAWSDGGKLMDGAVIRKTHNNKMGCTTIDEYRLILDARGEMAA